MKKLLLPVALLVLVAAACMPAAEPGTVDPQRLAAGEWQLLNIQYADGEVSTPEFGEYSLDFDFDEERMFVVADCNQGSASFEATEQGQFVVGPLGLTRMACPPGSISAAFAAELGLVNSYAFQDSYLVLSNLDGTSLLFSR